jgi:hypothetical protein
MSRFTIRDLLWLAVVVAMGVAWLLDHRGKAKGIGKARQVPLSNATLLMAAFHGIFRFASTISLRQNHCGGAVRTKKRRRTWAFVVLHLEMETAISGSKRG